jgi:hypothetical protein
MLVERARWRGTTPAGKKTATGPYRCLASVSRRFVFKGEMREDAAGATGLSNLSAPPKAIRQAVLLC